MTFARIRALIWGKTYPELSRTHVETVCTGALREDGTPIRLYPVPLRYMDSGSQYQLYDWIDVPVEKSHRDPRPESFKVVSDRIERVDHVGTEDGSWRTRRDLVFRDRTWHFPSMDHLKEAERESGRSMGLIAPGEVLGVRLSRKSASAAGEYARKLEELQSQRDVFRTEYKELEYLPYDVKIRWRCRETCSGCAHNPHDMKVLDWGLLELGRREGWEKARDRLESISNLTTHDFRLFMGNFRLHPRTFGVIGLWYPKLRPQLDLL